MWLSVFSFTEQELMGNVKYFGESDRLGGGAFGGTYRALDNYRNLYYQVVRNRDILFVLHSTSRWIMKQTVDFGERIKTFTIPSRQITETLFL